MTKSRRTPYYSVRSFASYLSQYRLRLSVVIAVFAIANVFLAVIPLFIGKLVGSLTAQPIQGHHAVIYAWLLIACSSGHNLLWRGGEFLDKKYITPLGYLYENSLFRTIIGKPYPYFVDKFTGKIASYINTISQECREFLQGLLYSYVGSAVNLVAVAIILTTINWQTGLVFLLGVVSMTIVGRHTIRNSTHYEKHLADAQSTKNGRIIDAIANFVNVKSFQKEAVEIQAIEQEQQTTIAAARTSLFWGIIFWGSMSLFVRDIIWPITIGLNVYLFLHHELSISQLATLLSTILIFSSTIWEAVWNISQFNLKLARAEEAHRYLFGEFNITRRHDTANEQTAEQRTMEHELTIRNLQFAYPDKPDTPVLTNINLTLKRGEKVGIVGRSGSGKTTLTKLLLDYYPVASNEIVVDGNPINLRDLARLISYVPQDTSLFYRSIADNIAYAADRPVSREEIITAAKQAHADEFITRTSEGYEALVGERGVKLSSGQRQRIAIARALLDNKPLLILDEATSALDSESEVLVQEALEALWEHKTVIAIAHRLSTLRHMDRILVMDKGQIVEEGSHKELLKIKGGAYAKLWNHQSGGFIEE
jgi:ABC-type multidrug transport system fused ATPase/permease subunit